MPASLLTGLLVRDSAFLPRVPGLPAVTYLSPRIGQADAVVTAHHEFDKRQLVWLVTDDVLLNLGDHAALLEQAIDLCGGWRVASWVRCPDLNKAVGGSGSSVGQKPSAHLSGRATDMVSLDMPLLDAYKRIVASKLPFEKALLERRKSWWIHLQSPKIGEAPRRAAFVTFNGGTTFSPFNVSDPRLSSITPLKEYSRV